MNSSELWTLIKNLKALAYPGMQYSRCRFTVSGRTVFLIPVTPSLFFLFFYSAYTSTYSAPLSNIPFFSFSFLPFLLLFIFYLVSPFPSDLSYTFPPPFPSPSSYPSCFHPSYLHFAENKNNSKRCVLPIHEDITLKFCLTWRKRRYTEIKDDSKIRRQKNIDRHCPRPIPNVCQRPNLRVLN